MFLRWKVKYNDWLRQKDVEEKYYVDSAFREIDKELLRRYRWKNPYAMARRCGQVYGETPLVVYDEIAKRTGLQSGERFLELGCGRGRGCYFLNHFYRCEARGVDLVPGFIERAIEVPGVDLECGDFFKHGLSGDVIYLYSTCMSSDELEKMMERLMGSGARVVTVSTPLMHLHLIDEFIASFPWGEGTLYLHQA